MALVTHGLTFMHPVPGAMRTPDGYRIAWRGVALMGVVNITPDSFSDGGRYLAATAAVAQARALTAQGALIIDLGAESSRPGAEPVSAEEELARLLPVLAGLRDLAALISVDTAKPAVAEAALAAGAHLINDIGGLRKQAMLEVCARYRVPVVVMHMQGEPLTMQQAPHYHDVVAEVTAFLAAAAERALKAGVPSVILDPGIGFGKTLAHNLALLRGLNRLVALGHPVLVGVSRKRLIGELTGVAEPSGRDLGSIAAGLYAAAQGAGLLRVHKVAEHTQALKVWQALQRDNGG
ncbi:MAG: dihydropteroate synthase [Truepera sp.]|nr:dihydropteroate synthase [Truepera sp.]